MSDIVIPPADREAMGRALELAREAAAAGEVPVGALVLGPSGEILGEGRNSRIADRDVAAHAEVMALRAAAGALGGSTDRASTRGGQREGGADWQVPGATLVVTLEPCVLCAGALLAARVSRVVFGAWDVKSGAAGSVYDLLRDGRLPHEVPEVIGGVREEECATVMRDFFAERR